MTWGADGEICTSAGDPCWGQSHLGLDVEKFTGYPPDYSIHKTNDMPGYDGGGGAGPKPTGMISVDGTLDLAFQNLLGAGPPAHGTNSQHGSDAAIVRSRDFGKSWEPGIDKLSAPMFPGCKFGGPAFVNFGQDNVGARDEFVYAVSADQWDNGSHLWLGRVPNYRILDVDAWEWATDLREGRKPRWTDSLDGAVPVLSHDRHISLPEMVYLASVERYLLLTWRLHRDFSNEHGSSLIVYESPEPWGPFTLAHYEPQWETDDVTPYCPRLPLRWMGPDGLTGWLQFSGSWRRDSPHYRSNMRRFRLLLR